MAIPPIELLPNEILAEIFTYASPRTLLSLALVSQKFNRSTTPLIYHTISIQEADRHHYNQPWEVRRWEYFLSTDANPRQVLVRDSIVVKDFTLLSRTLRQSPRLLSHVVCVAIEWDDDAVWNNRQDILHNLIELLGPHARHMHLGPATTDLEVISRLPVTSLQCNTTTDVYFEADEHSSLEEEMFGIMSLPGLQRASFERIDSWWLSEFSGSLTKSHFSNVTSLTFTQSAAAGPSLIRILTWPIALRSLYFELQTGDFYEIPSETPEVSARAFAAALQSQAGSLEELLIIGEECDYTDHTTIGSLRNFPKLKRLGLPKQFIRLSEELKSTYPESSEIYAQSDVARDLPPALEVLQIEFDTAWEMASYFCGKKIEDMEEKPHETRDWLCKIAGYKRSRYPSLRKIILWNYDQYDNFGYQWSICPLAGYKDAMDVMIALNKEGIKFSAQKWEDPPIFSLENGEEMVWGST